MILDDLVAATKKRVAASKATLPLTVLEREARALPVSEQRPFENRLKQPGFHIIAEVKKASPSKGLIAPQFPYLTIAQEYDLAGADAISVLTEPDYFQGSLTYLKEIAAAVTTPVLRKDFTVDPYMIYEAKVAGAAAVLLIVSILTDDQLRNYLALADELGLSALVEAHDETEIKRALAAGARIIGVNNRNLKTFTVDFSNSERLRQLVPNDRVFVAESGVKQARDADALQQHNIHVSLIGETLMRATNKTQLIHELKGMKTGDQG